LRFSTKKIQTGGIGDSLKVLKETLELFTTELEDIMVQFILKDGVLMFQHKSYMTHTLPEILEEM